MEAKIQEEISFFVRELEGRRTAKGGPHPVNVHELLTPSVSNNICILMFGHRFDYDDPIRMKARTCRTCDLNILEYSKVLICYFVV